MVETNFGASRAPDSGPNASCSDRMRDIQPQGSLHGLLLTTISMGSLESGMHTTAILRLCSHVLMFGHMVSLNHVRDLLSMCSGHTHYNNNRTIHGTRLYSNQLGYPVVAPEKYIAHQLEMQYDKELVIVVSPGCEVANGQPGSSDRDFGIANQDDLIGIV